MREYFFEMTKSVFWRDEEVVLQNTFLHVLKGSEIPDRTGSNIPDTAVRKTRRIRKRRKTQTNAKRHMFYANPKRDSNTGVFL